MKVQLMPLSLIVSLLLSCATLAQEMRTIRGKVKPKSSAGRCNQSVALSNVKISVIKNNGEAVHPDPQHSRGEDWSHLAPANAVVKIGFIHADYRPKRIPSYTVQTTDPQQLEDVWLNPVAGARPCPKNMSRARVFQRGGRDSTHTLGVETGTASRENETAEAGDNASTAAAAAQDAKPTPEQLLAMLKEDSEIALEFGALDVFQYNFELLLATLGRDSKTREVLNSFRAQNGTLFEPQGNRRPEVFRKIIEQQFEPTQPPDFSLFSGVANDPALDPSIRGSAVVALLDAELSAQQKETLRDSFRSNMKDTSNPVYLTSVIALARIGDADDRKRIQEDTGHADEVRVDAALRAIRVARITEGANLFAASDAELARIATSNKDEDIRLLAIQALRPAAYYLESPTALSAFRNALADDESVPVRIEAADALGLGTLENRLSVRQALNVASREDASPLVREAATASLRGKQALPKKSSASASY